jgi:hypothetical protein
LQTPDSASREPQDESEQHRGVKAEEGSIGLPAQVPVQFEDLKKDDAADPNEADKPFPEYRMKVFHGHGIRTPRLPFNEFEG